MLAGLGILAPRLPGAAVARAPADGGAAPEDDGLTLALTGDVMTGRGIDQVLPHPSDPSLYEPAMTSALGYVEIAEAANGPIARPVDYSYVWGAALAELEARRPDALIINLETAVTASDTPAPKGINYRMHPRNLPVLEAAGVDCCVLANNHVLDWREAGLIETLESLEGAGLAIAGAGRDRAAAAAPAVLPGGREARVLVFGFGAPSSGIPESWAATGQTPGVNFLDDLSDEALARVAGTIRAARSPGDIVVASIHWGPNWGYEIPRRQVAFAHGLIDEAGVDIVHGHSSHHPKGIEVYRGRPILYGCGDFLNDYEGISGYESYRDDLVLLYLPTVQPDGSLARLTMVPFRIRNFRLERPSAEDAAWLRDTLDRESRPFGSSVRLETDDSLTLDWA